MSRLQNLETLNIRNLPVNKSAKSWLPMDHMQRGLVLSLLDSFPFLSRPRLTILALGANESEDRRLKLEQKPYDHFQDLLKL